MKTLILLLLATAGLGAAYWKVQHPDATLDDVKLGATSTLERAKTGLSAFRDGGGANSEAIAVAAEQEAQQDAQVDGRLTDNESRMDATDTKISQINDSVNALSVELDTVSSSLGNLNDNVAAAAGADQGLVDRFDAMNQRVDALASEVQEQNAEQILTNIGTRIDSIDTRLNDLSQSNTQTLSDIGAKVTDVADQNTALQARINTLSVGASGDDDAGGNLRAQVDQRLQEIESKLATTNSNSLRVSSLLERLNTTDEVLQALQTSVDKTAALEAEVTKANEKIASLTAEINELKTNGTGASVESLQADLTGQLEQLESRIENTNDNTDISTLNIALATTRERIQQLEQRVQTLPTDGEAAQAAQSVQSDLQQQIAAMETRLRALPQQTDPELLNTLNKVQADVAELRDRGTPNDVEYKVYFAQSSVSISDEAAVVLRSFIRQEQNRTTGVNIYGFTDRSGDAAYNQRLALQRATSVRSFLIQNGFDFTKIKSLSGLGEDAAAATLDDGAEDADQRTVVLVANQP